MERENRFMSYMKQCMLAILLFGFANPIYSTGFKTGEELGGNLNLVEPDSLKTEQLSDSVSFFATSSCVNTFENQTVSSTLSVQGCNTLVVQNVTVTPNGDLTLTAPDAVLINGPFEAQLGGVLNIKKKEASTVEFIYNAAGNRILRRVISCNLF